MAGPADARDGVERRRDFPSLVAADALGVSADLAAEFGLGTPGFLAELADAVAEGHERGSFLVQVPHPLCGHAAAPAVFQVAHPALCATADATHAVRSVLGLRLGNESAITSPLLASFRPGLRRNSILSARRAVTSKDCGSSTSFGRGCRGGIFGSQEDGSSCCWAS